MDRILKVSVIIAAFNVEPYLRQTLDSITKQSLRDIEIICVDDGSADRTYDIMQEYAEHDERIRVLQYNEPSAGAGAARNMGLAEARGEFLAILDGDDFFEPDMLAKAYAKARETNAEIVAFDGDLFDQVEQTLCPCDFILRRNLLPKKSVFRPDEWSKWLYTFSIGSAWNLLISRSLVREHGLRFESIHHADDLTFVCLALTLANRIAILPERLIHYRRNNAGSQYATLSKWPLSCCEALERLQVELKNRHLYEQYKVAFIRRAVRYCQFYLDVIEDWQSFLELYQKMRETYLNKFDCLTASTEEIGDAFTTNQRDIIRDIPPDEYYFELDRRYKRCARDNALCRPKEAIYSRVPDGARIVIYGAGDQGRRLYAKTLQSQRWRVVGWTDQNYKSLGYPVMSPEDVTGIVFDYVVIAIEKVEVCEAVKKYLEKLGVAEEKIVRANIGAGLNLAIAPPVSVVMPVLNGLPYFPKALDSVRAQTLRDIEIIIVDAGSTDGTREYIESCQKLDGRIKLIESACKSMGMQYNLGMAAACGEYVGFCESDDYIEPEMMKSLYQAARENGCPESVKSDINMFVETAAGTVTLRYGILPRNRRDMYGKMISLDNMPDLFYREVNIWNGIYRADFLRSQGIRMNESSGASFQDTGFICQVHFLAKRILYLEKAFYHYRRDNQGSSMFKKNTGLFCLQELNYMLNFLDEHPKIKNEGSIFVMNRLLGVFAGFYGKNRYWNTSGSYEHQVEKLPQRLKEFLLGMSAGKQAFVLENNVYLNLLLESVDVFRGYIDATEKAQEGKHRRFGSFLSKQKQVVIFGSGERGMIIAALLANNAYAGSVCFCDNNKAMQGTSIMGKKIYSPQEAALRYAEAIFILPTPNLYWSMREQLLKLGVSDGKIIWSPPVGAHDSMEIDWKMLASKSEEKHSFLA